LRLVLYEGRGGEVKLQKFAHSSGEGEGERMVIRKVSSGGDTPGRRWV